MTHEQVKKIIEWVFKRSSIQASIANIESLSTAFLEAHPEEENDPWSTVYGPRPVTGKQIRDAMAKQLTPEVTAPPTLRERAVVILDSHLMQHNGNWVFDDEGIIQAMLQFASEVGGGTG